MLPRVFLFVPLMLVTGSVIVSGWPGDLVQDVRLVGGRRSDQGTVEVKIGGQWGTVCDDEWDHKDARVVCRMLRQSGGVAYSSAYFGQGGGRILLDSVGCAGDEANLNMCTLGMLDPASSTCGHYEDAGVRCGSDPFSDRSYVVKAPQASPLDSNCNGGINSNPNVRLVGSDKLPSAGFVQARDLSSGITEFGFVCDDNWNLLNARVVCRELCYNPEDAQPGWHKPRSVQMPANPDIVLDKVQCSGAEGSLVDCRHLPWNINDCSPTELAAVTCTAVTRSLQVPQADVECQRDKMVVTFLKRTNPSLRKETIVTGEDVPSTCKLTMSEDSTRIKVTMPYDQCARLSQDQEGPSGNMTFMSYLLVPLTQDPSPSNGMSRITKFKVNLQCNVAVPTSASRMLPHVGQPVLPAVGDVQMTITMKMYKDDTFTTPVDGTEVVLAPGGWVNLGLRLSTEDERVKLVVTSCTAGPDLSDPSKPRQALFLNKCIQEDTVSVYTLSNHFWGIRFQPFSFNSYTDVNVDCVAYACLADVASEVCDRSCNSANTKYNKKSLTRRKRRSLEPRQPQQPGSTASQHLHQSPYVSDTATHKTLKQPKINTSRQDDIFRIPLLNRATVLEAKGKKRWNNRSGSPLSGVSVPADPANQTEKDQPWERTVAKAVDSLAELSQKQNQSQSKSANGATASFLQSKYLLHARITITFA